MISLRRLAPGINAVTRPAPIGFDLASEKLHMVQMQRSAGGPAISAAISVPFPGEREALLADPARLRSFIKPILRPFRGRRIFAALPLSDLKIMLISYQPAAGQSEQEAVLKELKERLREELDESVVDYVPIRNEDSDAPKDVLVAVAKRDRVIAYLDLLRSAGVEPVALDIGPAALCRLVSAMQAQKINRNVLLINFGMHKSYLTVIWGTRLMLDREIEFGEAQLIARLTKRLDMSESLASQLLYRHGFHCADNSSPHGEDHGIAQSVTEILRAELTDLVNEIHKTLLYTASKTRGSSVDHIYMLGSLARYRHSARWIQNALSIPAEVLNPFTAFINKTTNASAADAGIALATGLALRGIANVRH